MATTEKTPLGKWIRAVSNFTTLVQFHKICLLLGFFSAVNSKGLYLSWEKGKENCCLVLTSSIKCKTRMFHVVLVQQKSVMHVQSCCFVNLNLLLFCRSRYRRQCRCLSSILIESRRKKASFFPPRELHSVTITNSYETYLLNRRTSDYLLIFNWVCFHHHIIHLFVIILNFGL